MIDKLVHHFFIKREIHVLETLLDQNEDKILNLIFKAIKYRRKPLYLSSDREKIKYSNIYAYLSAEDTKSLFLVSSNSTDLRLSKKLHKDFGISH